MSAENPLPSSRMAKSDIVTSKITFIVHLLQPPKCHTSITTINTMIGKHTSVVHLLCVLGIVSSLLVETDSAKVKRVKAGKIYNQHDAVNIVVNKVG
jgi:hypothetical protein